MSNPNEIPAINLVDQTCVTGDVVAETPLFHAGLHPKSVSPENNGVFLSEDPLVGHLSLRGNPEKANLQDAVQAVFGLDLPGPLQSCVKDEVRICWLSPDEWLIMLPYKDSFEKEVALRKHLSGHISIVNLSGGQTVLNLSGPAVQKVLKKSTPYDVHDDNFATNKVVGTIFAKSQAIVIRTGAQDWQLVVRRSFADYIWAWLQDASREYGLNLPA